MAEIKVQKFGKSLGVILPNDAIRRLRTGEGDRLFLLENPDGSYRLTALDPRFEMRMAKGDDIMRRYRNTLELLSK